MFYISSSRKPSEIRYVALPAEYQDSGFYFQIYENGKSLKRMTFITKKQAKRRLKTLREDLMNINDNLYDYEHRLTVNVPIKNIRSKKDMQRVAMKE